jgi:hypothetical protein
MSMHWDYSETNYQKMSLCLKKWPPMVSMIRGDTNENKDNNKWAEGEWKNNNQSLWGDKN